MQRRVVVVFASLVAASAAFLPYASRAEPPVTYVEAPVRTDAVSVAIIETARARASAVGLTGGAAELRAKLAALYEARGGRPIWLTDQGFSAQAGAAADEIARADQWGLDRRAYPLPDPADAHPGADPATRAIAEVILSETVLTYAAHARGWRVDPSQLSKWLDQTPREVDAGVVGRIADAEDPAAALRALHPWQPGFDRLRQAWLKLRSGEDAAEPPVPQVILPSSGRILRPGIRHRDVALLRRRLGVTAAPDGETVYDDGLVAAVRAFQASADLKVNSVVNAPVRQALNREVRGEGKRSRVDEEKLLAVNMERWRWLPDDLGATFTSGTTCRSSRPGWSATAGSSIEERIIIGKTETQTPVFSDTMTYVVFNPQWGVPGSIKVKDLLPTLQAGDLDVLRRRDMRIVITATHAFTRAKSTGIAPTSASVPIVRQPAAATRSAA